MDGTRRSLLGRGPFPVAATLPGGRSAATGLVMVAPLALALIVVIATWPAAPRRGVAALYFTLLFLPGFQAAAWAFWGRAGALTVGVTLALLTWVLVVLPHRALETQPVQWAGGFSAADQVLRSSLHQPRPSHAAEILGAGGTARVFICIARGSTDDLEIQLNDEALQTVARPSAWSCWLELTVPPDHVPAPGRAAEVTIRPRPQLWRGG